MNKYDSLIVKIADEYNIVKGKLEPINGKCVSYTPYLEEWL